jgi:hypothetical protein
MMSLEKALQGKRAEIEQGLADAEAELAVSRERCAAIEALIARGRAALEALDGERRSGMYLQDAMEKVLREEPNGVLRAGEIARRINQAGLYRQRDGGPVTAHQIHARVYNYSELFKRTANGIGLRRG